MRKSLIVMFAILVAVMLVLSSCKKAPTVPERKDLMPVEQVGIVPAEFENIVSDNLFYDVTAFADRLLKAQCISFDENAHTADYQVKMMDLYGNVLASCDYTTGDTHRVGTLTVTKDGGFLFVSAFEDRAYEQGVWASDSGVTSHVVKCDNTGKIEWDFSLNDYEGAALRFCFESGGNYCFFGDNQVPETKQRGVYSLTDICLTVLSADGKLIQRKRISGTDFDSLSNAEETEGGFLLSITSQSDDGDFAGSGSGGYGVSWIFRLDCDLNILEKKIAKGRDYLDNKLGEKNGKPIYTSDDLFQSFDAGSPKTYIDYGAFYLIVSENATGIYENTPLTVSRIWYYTETVYSAYDKVGNLMFRASVDSSPDYSAWIDKWQE